MTIGHISRVLLCFSFIRKLLAVISCVLGRSWAEEIYLHSRLICFFLFFIALKFVIVIVMGVNDLMR